MKKKQKKILFHELIKLIYIYITITRSIEKKIYIKMKNKLSNNLFKALLYYLLLLLL
jgi:hypothetical protein